MIDCCKLRERGFEVLPEYEHLNLSKPRRATKKSGGYDIPVAISGMIPPGETRKIPTGLTVYMQDNETLDLHIRSGLAAKHNLTLQDDVGIIDADYYGKHIYLLIRNEGDKPFYFSTGERLAQGIFRPFLLADDDDATGERTGGLGSTGI